MTQWLRALAAFAEGLGSNPSIQTAAHNQLQEDLVPFSDPEGTKHTPGAHKLKQNTHTLKTNKTTLKKNVVLAGIVGSFLQGKGEFDFYPSTSQSI